MDNSENLSADDSSASNDLYRETEKQKFRPEDFQEFRPEDFPYAYGSPGVRKSTWIRDLRFFG